MEKIEKYGKRYLTTEELSKASEDLAISNLELRELEDEKKSVTSQLKSRADFTQAKINQLSEKVRNKYEYCPIECEVKYDATKGIKTFYSKETGEVVAQEKMTEDDYQLEVAM